MAGTPANPISQHAAVGKAADGSPYQLRVDSEGRLVPPLLAEQLTAAGWTLSVVAINQAAAGVVTLSAAAEGKVNALFKLFMTLDDDAASGTIQVMSGATALTGAMPYSKFAGPADDCGIPGLPLTCGTNEALTVTLTGCGGAGYAVVGQKDA